jgi:hypothetical protein
MANSTWRTGIGLTLVLGLLLMPSPAAAAGITVIESQASYSFAQQMTFTLRAASDAQITQVYLFYQATGNERTQSVNIAIGQAGEEIVATHMHDLRLFPLPPFATVTFWWQIEDSDGRRLVTDPQQFEYSDNRFRWEQLGDGNLTVHWIVGQGDPAFGQAALDIARSSVEEINVELRAPLPAIHIYIYDRQSNLSAAMMLAGREWISGQAHPELGVIAIAIPSEEGYTSRMMRDIPHEITHLLVYQAVTPAGYHYVPEWLDEGLATANERTPNPDYATILEEARVAGRLLPLESLCVPFPPDAQTARLAYAESGSVVEFIRQRYGAPEIRALLAAYAEGASCTAGVQKALGISFNRLETEWLASLTPKAPWQAWVEQTGVWVGLWLLGLLVAVPMIGRLRRQPRR